MKTVPETTRMQRTTKDQLGFRVPSADARHHSRAYRSINYVVHESACIAWEGQDRAWIPQNTVQAIKEIDVIVRRMARADFGHRKASGNVPDNRRMRLSQRYTRISQFATPASLILDGPPVKQDAKCRPAAQQP